MKIAVLGAMSADHLNEKTHIHVDLWEVLAAGIRKKGDTYELAFSGATLDVALIKPAVKEALVAAGAIGADDEVLTQTEAR